jgi:O-antigen/teichoic acid export membrane protein
MKLLKNSLWSISAIAVPMVFALPALGIISRMLGVERFGLFTLIFALVGFASIFDVGLSRAVTREVALSKYDKIRITNVLNTSSSVLLISGLVCLGICFYLNENIVKLLNVSEEVSNDLNIALRCAYFIIPVFLLTLVRYAVYEGMQLFAFVSKVRILSNILLSISPLVFVFVDSTLYSAILGLLTARIISFVIIFYTSRKILAHSDCVLFDTIIFRNLIKFGGWVTVSNLISPLMNYFDRFVLSNISGASLVAFYTGPAEAVSKLSSLPSAISKALFPSIAADESNNIYHLMLLLCLLASFVALPVFIFSDQIMIMWLGADFEKSGVVLKILIIGFVFNATAQIPYTYIQATDKAHLTAAIHISEIIPYLVILYFFILNFGIIGAAAAWVIRVFVDLTLLSVTYKYLSNHR